MSDRIFRMTKDANVVISEIAGDTICMRMANHRIDRATWEMMPDDIKWSAIWLAHGTLEAEGIWPIENFGEER